MLEHSLLAKNDSADRRLGGSDLRRGRLCLAHDHVFQLFETFGRYRHSIHPGIRLFRD